MRIGKHIGCLIVVVLACAACATPRSSPDALPDIAPNQRPALDTDEAGLWMTMDRYEKGLRTSGHLVTDPNVNSYIRGIICRLAGPHCSDIRIYVVETPYFNASMAPNGVMQVWTGLILRSQNEAQLAYILGHEIGHYLRRHSLQLWRNARSTTDILGVFSVLTAGAGVGIAGSLVQLVGVMSIYAYSRDNEREADEVGFELMVKAGYDPREASLVWEGLMKEKEASKESAPAIFFASHPPTEERIETLKGLAQKDMVSGKQYDVGSERFLATTMPIRGMLLRDELRRHEFAQSQTLLDRLIQGGAGLGELHYYQGELYRLRAGEGDEAKAVQAYQKALEVGGAPVETHRALGLLFFKAGDKANARAAFDRYLVVHPQATDQEMIRFYLRQLE